MINIIGSLAYDRIMVFQGSFKDHLMPDKLHALSVSFPISFIATHRGGTAGNIAYNLCLLGRRPSIVACAGDDFQPYEEDLRRLGCDLSKVDVIPGAMTASATIITDKSNNQITGFFQGAMDNESKAVFTAKNRGEYFIVSPGNTSEMERYCKMLNLAGLEYIFDPGQQITTFTQSGLAECIRSASMLIVKKAP
jgi:adenosine kinase